MNERDYTYIFKKLLEITDDGFVIIDKDVYKRQHIRSSAVWL